MTTGKQARGVTGGGGPPIFAGSREEHSTRSQGNLRIMQKRQLGPGGPSVSAVGVGAMSFTSFYGPTDEAASHAILNDMAPPLEQPVA